MAGSIVASRDVAISGVVVEQCLFVASKNNTKRAHHTCHPALTWVSAGPLG